MKENAKKILIDDLAVMVGNGFIAMEKRIGDAENGLEKRLGKRIDDLEETLVNRINGIERRIDDLSLNRATRDEMRILDLRVTKIEKKIEAKR